jgi:hypothetical protein
VGLRVGLDGSGKSRAHQDSIPRTFQLVSNQLQGITMKYRAFFFLSWYCTLQNGRRRCCIAINDGVCSAVLIRVQYRFKLQDINFQKRCWLKLPVFYETNKRPDSSKHRPSFTELCNQRHSGRCLCLHPLQPTTFRALSVPPPTATCDIQGTVCASTHCNQRHSGRCLCLHPLQPTTFRALSVPPPTATFDIQGTVCASTHCNLRHSGHCLCLHPLQPTTFRALSVPPPTSTYDIQGTVCASTHCNIRHSGHCPCHHHCNIRHSGHCLCLHPLQHTTFRAQSVPPPTATYDIQGTVCASIQCNIRHSGHCLCLHPLQHTTFRALSVPPPTAT